MIRFKFKPLKTSSSTVWSRYGKARAAKGISSKCRLPPEAGAPDRSGSPSITCTLPTVAAYDYRKRRRSSRKKIARALHRPRRSSAWRRLESAAFSDTTSRTVVRRRSIPKDHQCVRRRYRSCRYEPTLRGDPVQSVGAEPLQQRHGMSVATLLNVSPSGVLVDCGVGRDVVKRTRASNHMGTRRAESARKAVVRTSK